MQKYRLLRLSVTIMKSRALRWEPALSCDVRYFGFTVEDRYRNVKRWSASARDCTSSWSQVICLQTRLRPPLENGYLQAHSINAEDLTRELSGVSVCRVTIQYELTDCAEEFKHQTPLRVSTDRLSHSREKLAHRYKAPQWQDLHRDREYGCVRRRQSKTRHWFASSPFLWDVPSPSIPASADDIRFEHPSI